ncbi:GNAT family N-acetyltransferase [Rubrolithibacter danxiaensis]|uniref:GNAT family N-acetyltransferase n=1 Tax=Rubrolithibacter danxiaensis TaxID=3390805 RepID=UPI003BF8F8E5
MAERFIEERLRKEESVIFVAFDTVPVGFAQLYPKYSSARAEKNWILNDLFVEPEFRKRGVGAMLIKASVEFAKSKGAKFVQLETATDNFSAQRLYEATGFKKQEPDDKFFVYRIEVL